MNSQHINDIDQRAGLQGTAYHIYAHMLLLCSKHNGEISISIQKLARRCRCSPETVSTAIKKFQARGLLEIIRRTGLPNVYFLDPPIGSFESIRQIWLMAKWFELEAIPTAIQVKLKVSRRSVMQ
jgi:hypothetical protein